MTASLGGCAAIEQFVLGLSRAAETFRADGPVLVLAATAASAGGENGRIYAIDVRRTPPGEDTDGAPWQALQRWAQTDLPVAGSPAALVSAMALSPGVDRLAVLQLESLGGGILPDQPCDRVDCVLVIHAMANGRRVFASADNALVPQAAALCAPPPFPQAAQAALAVERAEQGQTDPEAVQLVYRRDDVSDDESLALVGWSDATTVVVTLAFTDTVWIEGSVFGDRAVEDDSGAAQTVRRSETLTLTAAGAGWSLACPPAPPAVQSPEPRVAAPALVRAAEGSPGALTLDGAPVHAFLGQPRARFRLPSAVFVDGPGFVGPVDGEN